jgi:rhamnulokinase
MNNPGEFARCIFESLAFRYRQTLEELKQISNRKIGRLHIIGGGSQNWMLCQFTADATGLPVVAGPAEGTALGNVMVQAMAHGMVQSLTEIRRMIRNSFEFKEFIPENGSEWNRHYERFLDVCHRLRSQKNQAVQNIAHG